VSRQKVEDTVREMVEPVVASLDMEAVDVEYVKEGGAWFIRVFIDKPGGITHDDCQAVSERLSELLDEKDPVPHAYILEVSSPGIERPLKRPEDFVRFKGHKVRASTFSPVNGSKEFIGLLEGLEDGKISIDIHGKQVSLPVEAVARVRLEAEF